MIAIIKSILFNTEIYLSKLVTQKSGGGNISFNLFRRNKTDSRLKKAFGAVKAELEDHLEGINQNTNEIQSNYEFLCELDSKIEKLNEKIEEIQMFLYPDIQKKTRDDFHIEPLTRREQEIFVVLYSNEQLTFKDISRRTALPEEMVRMYISNMIKKGVPLTRNSSGTVILDSEFKTLQAKENIVKINETLAKETC